MNRAGIFLKAYAETGSVTKAAEAAQISRSIHYRRLKEDPAYKEAFDQAHEVAIAVLEDEAVRRAVEGVEEPVTYQGSFSYLPKIDENGEVVVDPDTRRPVLTDKPVTIRKYSDSLLQFLLRGAKPEKYRERYNGPSGGQLKLKFRGSLEELIVTYRNLVGQEEAEDEDEDEPKAA